MPLPRSAVEAVASAGAGAEEAGAEDTDTDNEARPNGARSQQSKHDSDRMEHQALQLVERQLARLEMEYEATHEAKRWEAEPEAEAEEKEDPFEENAHRGNNEVTTGDDGDADPWVTFATRDLIAAGCDPASLGYSTVEQIPSDEQRSGAGLSDDDSGEDGEFSEWSAATSTPHVATPMLHNASTASTAPHTPTSSLTSPATPSTPTISEPAIASSAATAAPLPVERIARIKQIASSIQLQPPGWARGMDDAAWKERVLQRAGLVNATPSQQAKRRASNKSHSPKASAAADEEWVRFE